MSATLQPNDASPDSPGDGAEPRWQFSLRTLFIWTALFGILFAILSRVGLLWSAVIVWFLLLAALHVLGNVWGSHVRTLKAAPDADEDAAALAKVPRPVTFAPTTRLCRKTRLGWIMPTVTIVAALLGGTAGGLALVFLYWGHLQIAGLLVGIVSASILGGFFGFLTSSFIEVSARAWREAAAEQSSGKLRASSRRVK